MNFVTVIDITSYKVTSSSRHSFILTQLLINEDIYYDISI